MSQTEDTQKPAEIVRETVSARHDFSDAEKLKLSEQLVQSMNVQTQIDDEFSSVKAEFKCRIEKSKLETDSLAQRLRDGFEMRPTIARILFNVPTKGRKTFVRDDDETVIIREEPMTYTDEHRPLFPDANGQDSTGKAPAPIPNPPTFEDEEGNKFDPLKAQTPGGEDAGTTSLGTALDSAAVNTEQPLVSFPALDEPNWQAGGLIKAFEIAIKKAKWAKTAVSMFLDQLKACGDDVEAIKRLIRPQTIGGQTL